MKTKWIAAAMVIGVTGFLSGPAQARNHNPRVLPVPTGAHGGYSQLAAAWWQWTLNTEASVNPLFDTTGEFGAVNQSGPVWFLTGNTGGETVRSVTVPAGKALFFPIVNDFLTDEGTVEEMRAAIAADIDSATDLACEIDGRAVQDLLNYRVQSVEFGIDVPEDNIFGDPTAAGHYEPAVDDGIYLLVAPLRVGEHTIHFHGTIATVGFTLDVTYHLTVVPTD